MHKIIFTIHGFEIYSYAIMMVIGFLICLLILQKRSVKYQIPVEVVMDLAFYLVIGGVLGARLIYVLQNIPYYSVNIWEIFNLRAGGLSWHGAMLGGILVLYLYTRKKKITMAQLFDLIAPVWMFGLSIGRIGCFLNGCCYGKETRLPWGIIFREDGFSTPRHPTQLYEMLLIWLSLPVLYLLEKKQKFPGELLWASIILYAMVRFIVEFFRESAPLPWALGLSAAQVASLLSVALILPYIIYRRKKLDEKN